MVDTSFPTSPAHPVDQFLRLCLNCRRYPPHLQAAHDLVPQLDWQSLITYAAEKYVTPAIYHCLKGSSFLPAEVEGALRAAYLETARRNLLQAYALKQLMARFSTAGIEILLLKGLALALIVYQDIAARPARDLDLLIKAGDLTEALSLANGLGYQRYDLPEHTQTDLEFENEVILFRQQDSMNVDLHWSLFDSPYYQSHLDMGWFWDHLIEFDLAGMKLKTLAPEANLIYLCAHLIFHHKGNELLWLNDIAELLFTCQNQMNWQLVLTKAQEFRLVMPLRQVLEVLARDWQAEVPTGVLESLVNAPVSQEEQHLLNSLAGERQTSGQHFLSDLQLLAGGRRKIKYALQLLFPTPKYMLHHYHIPHPWLVPLFYPYRWWLGITSLIRPRN